MFSDYIISYGILLSLYIHIPRIPFRHMIIHPNEIIAPCLWKYIYVSITLFPFKAWSADENDLSKILNAPPEWHKRYKGMPEGRVPQIVAPPPKACAATAGPSANPMRASMAHGWGPSGSSSSSHEVAPHPGDHIKLMYVFGTCLLIMYRLIMHIVFDM